MKKLSSFLLPVLIIAVALGLFRFLKATKPEQPPPKVQERVWRVAVEAVKPQALAPELMLYGQVETPDLLKLTASANAWVERVGVRDGQLVTKGEVLIQLDPRDFEPRIDQARAEIAELKASIESENNRQQSDQLALEQEQQLLDLAGQSVERQQRLKTQKVGAEQSLDEAMQQQAQQALSVSNRKMSIADHPNRLRGLQAKLASAQARLDQLELEYERASLSAPYDGVIANVEVTAGDQVSRGEVLLMLYARSSLEVRARIPAPYQDEILAAMNAGKTLSASAQVAGAEVALRLGRLDGEAQASGIDGLFQVQSNADLLRIGQLLTLRLARGAQSDAVALPMAAVYGGERVYEIQTQPPETQTDGAKTGDEQQAEKPAEPTLRMRSVDIDMLGTRRGADGRELALVRSPELTAGDRVVITHLPNAIDGLRVEVVQ
ncbi:efflux RND transporter periplasmic adaptor subunit [Thiorhodovibrio frisius]|uniref:Multidrug resistance efflux pump n=1 Tax=Thiorhodovibrio frisius TaxID=631362 RepID=H8Z580_9GAMM|nr:biotin/lipoyl-binding protein [Thiorhodovibrio frisius]EIC20487.1 multidrug resistance efflux pump [Thiorhodovibrio frisius]WPL21228.1 p-hydroxybenzoic acid efflux pump subunit AaeA [Thiorhodovibrio frisius]